jgi:hypothetical protein
MLQEACEAPVVGVRQLVSDVQQCQDIGALLRAHPPQSILTVARLVAAWQPDTAFSAALADQPPHLAKVTRTH